MAGQKAISSFRFVQSLEKQSNLIWLLSIRSFSCLNNLFVRFEKLKNKILVNY